MSAMDKLNAALVALADIIAWQGEEDHEAVCIRIEAAEKTLKGVAPDILKRAKERVRAWRKENEITD